MATLIVVEDLCAPATLGRGGQAMHLMRWLHGFRRAGHRVLFVEFLEKIPHRARSGMVRYFGETIEQWWDPEWSALIHEPTKQSLYGLDAVHVAQIAAEAAAVITVSAHYRRDPYPLIEGVRPRLLLEMDPGYTHLWAADDPADVFGEHDLYFTVGANVGSPCCRLPTRGIAWEPILQPVLLDWWTADRPVTRDRFTTVADWRSYGYLEFEGQILGPKAEEFRKFIDLPRLAGEPVELAVRIDPEDPDMTEFLEHGWRLEDPETVASPALYRDYVAGSRGEFSCAKGGYVGTRSGWFSDRSACYLATGRPVVLQSTGFEDHLPTGRGLFAVSTVEEAAEAIRAIRLDYATHSAAARAIAREHLDVVKVCRHVLAEAGVS